MSLHRLNAGLRLVVAAGVILSLQACAVVAMGDAAVTVVKVTEKLLARSLAQLSLID